MRSDDISRWTAARWYRPLLSLHCWNNYKQGNHLPGGSKSICCCCCLYIYCYYHYHTITATCTSIFGFCLTGLYFVKSLQVKPVPKDLQKNLGDCYRTFFSGQTPCNYGPPHVCYSANSSHSTSNQLLQNRAVIYDFCQKGTLLTAGEKFDAGQEPPVQLQRKQ